LIADGPKRVSKVDERLDARRLVAELAKEPQTGFTRAYRLFQVAQNECDTSRGVKSVGARPRGNVPSAGQRLVEPSALLDRSESAGRRQPRRDRQAQSELELPRRKRPRDRGTEIIGLVGQASAYVHPCGIGLNVEPDEVVTQCAHEPVTLRELEALLIVPGVLALSRFDLVTG
jgi:hypothetical protein